MKKRTWIKSFIVLFAFFVSIVMVVPVNAAKLNKKTVTLLKNKTYTVKLKGSKKKAKWKTSNKRIAKIVKKTKFTAKIKAVKEGKATITAKIGKKVYKCKFIIVDPKLQSSLRLTVGDRYRLKTTGGTGKIIWKSTNPKVVSVVSGNITARNVGTARITAKQNGKTLTCRVKITAKNSSSQPEDPSSGGSDEEPPNIPENRKYNLTLQIFTNHRTEWECNCGFPEWGKGFRTENESEFVSHCADHGKRLEDTRTRVNFLKDHVCDIAIKFSTQEEYDSFLEKYLSLEDDGSRDQYAMNYYETHK